MAAPIVQIFEVGDYQDQVRRAADSLNQGGVVVLPTETVYGAAAILSQPKGLSRLRGLVPPAGPKPLVIHLADPQTAGRYTGPVGEFGQRMMRKLWPGPVAMVFEVPAERQREVAGDFHIGVDEIYDGGAITLRCPDHVVATDIIAGADGPVVIRKADGQTAHSAAAEWGGSVDLVLDAGPTQYSKPSTIVKVMPDSYEIVREGVYDRRIIERLLRTTFLFICSGNTCRSPMAEALTRQILARKLGVSEAEVEKKGIAVMSAGSFAMPGTRAAQPAIEAMAAMGLDVSHHRSRPLTVELIHQADMIYAMGRGHMQAVMAMVPSAADKVVMLDPERDIEDPIGGDVALYQSLAGRLRTLIEKRLEEQPIS